MESKVLFSSCHSNHVLSGPQYMVEFNFCQNLADPNSATMAERCDTQGENCSPLTDTYDSAEPTLGYIDDQ